MWDLQQYDEHVAMIDDKGQQVTYHELAEVQQRITKKLEDALW